MKNFVAVLVLMFAFTSQLSVAVAGSTDTSTQEQLCTRLSQSANSPGTYRMASDTCIQAAVGHKNRADAASGVRRQHELLYESAFMLLAAQAETHGGDADVRNQLLSKAKGIAMTVRRHSQTGPIKADAQRLLNDIQKAENH